jgi:hypothetical protein
VTGIIDGIPQYGATADDRHTFSSGAVSSGRKPPYHLIPAYALARIANRFKLGADKYGVDNWKKGATDRDFILDRINHAFEHLINLKEQVAAGDGETVETFDDDDAAAVILNAIFVMEWQVQRARPALKDGRAIRDIKACTCYYSDDGRVTNPNPDCPFHTRNR